MSKKIRKVGFSGQIGSFASDTGFIFPRILALPKYLEAEFRKTIAPPVIQLYTESMPAQTRETYQKIASIYAGPEVGEDDPFWRKACRDKFSESLIGTEILEIGCGPAVDGFKLSQQGLNVTVSDSSSAFLDIVNLRFPSLKTHLMDYTNPNLLPGTFDGIVGMATFIHVPHSEAETTLAGLRNLLRPEGVLFLTLIASDQVREYSVENFGGPTGGTVQFFCHSRSDFANWSKSAGFKSVETFEIPSTFYEQLPRLIEKGVHQYQVICRN